MRKAVVKRLKASLPKRIVRGREVGPTRGQVRKAKRVYTRARQGRTHNTNSREARMR